LSKPIRAVGRALDVLLCFSPEETELTLTEISERVELHKSTAHRVLATLENRRFVQHDPATGKYRLGLRVLELAMLVVEHMDIRRVAQPFLQRLSDDFRETIDLGVLDGTDVVYLDVIESPQRVKLAAAPGERLPACCTSSGKAILAYLPEKQARQIMVQGLRRYTANTIVSPEDLLADLRSTHERGFAISRSEFENGINAVAAPILDSKNRPIAVVALAGPSFRLSSERMMEVGPAVRKCANDIAREIGLAATLMPGINHSEALRRPRLIQPEDSSVVGT
jgi:DNA-binding IclR family transcriptional regulator